MPVTKQKKEEVLQELVDKFGKSKSVVFAGYRGLDVSGISDLRGKLREADAEMKVAKKTLITLAGKENKLDINPDIMEGPVAATFSYEDAMAGIKVLFNFSKENENLVLLGGVVDGKVVGPEVIQEYAKLPGREELLAKLMGSMTAPVSGTVGLFSNLIAGFVRVLDGYKDTKPAEASQAKEESTAPEAEPAEVNEEVKASEASAEEKPGEEASAEAS